MAFVDLGQLGYYTLSPAPPGDTIFVTVSNQEGQEFKPGQWYRSAFWLDADNSPGTDVAIADNATTGRYGEAAWIDNNGNVNIALTVVNLGTGTAAIGFEWLSAPELGE